MANKENIKLWVEALRSGDYKQGRGTLHDDQGFCCLGVACEVYQECVGGLFIHRMDLSGFHEYNGHGGDLPPALTKWLELEEDPIIGEKSAVILNDDDELSFNEIADAIEKEYLG